MNKYIESNYSTSDFDKYRDENGFVDLTKMGIKLTKESREGKGTLERYKNWINFNGTKALIRGEVVDNYGIYAELISEEIAKKVGIPTGHYDLVKLVEEDGTEKRGVVSEKVYDDEKDNMITLRSLIGDEEKDDGIHYQDMTDYRFTIRKIREKFEKEGKSQEEVKEFISEYNKRLIFYIATLETDKHMENISILLPIEGTNKQIKLSPNYDSEFSLMLENNFENVELMLNDDELFKINEEAANPKIGIDADKDKVLNKKGIPWKDTLNVLLGIKGMREFYEENIEFNIDMDEILENVEERIKAKLPEQVKIIAKTAYEYRQEEIEKLIDERDIGLDFNEENEENKEGNTRAEQILFLADAFRLLAMSEVSRTSNLFKADQDKTMNRTNRDISEKDI